MIPSYNKIPYAVPFKFTSVDDDDHVQAEVLVPYDVAVYAITMAVSSGPQAGFYHAKIQFQNYHTGSTLFDEPLQNRCIQTDARTPFFLPSCWWVRKNQKIICSLDSFDNVNARTYYITLLSYVTDTDPNPGKQPFVYSFPIFVGFQDNVSDTATLPFHQGGGGVTGSLAKPMQHDFEFCAMVLDPAGGDLSTAPQVPDNLPGMSIQISTQSRTTRKVRKYLDRFVIDGCIGGGPPFSQGDDLPFLPNTGNIRAFPADSAQQYWLPEREFVPKWDLIRVDLSPSPTFIGSNDIHSILNQQCCMAIIGNHIG